MDKKPQNVYVVKPKKIYKYIFNKYPMLEKARWQEVYFYYFLNF